MEWSTTKRMTNSVNDLLGGQTCSEVLLLHERPRWAGVAAAIGVVAAVALTIFVESFRPLGSVFVMLAILVPLNLLGRRWVLARSGASVLLAESPMFFPKATRFVAVEPAPISGMAEGGFLTKWFVLFERRFVIPRIFQRSLRRIIG